MSVSMQKSIRDNSEDLQDYLRDLKNWEKDIKKEDLKLSVKQTSLLPTEELPAVRNKSSRLTEAIMKENHEEIPRKRERKINKISAYDYAAWDNFDVDKALESEEEPETNCKESKSSIAKEITAHHEEKVEPISNYVTENSAKRANKLKEEGNLCYSSGRLKDAIGKYTQGIGLNPSSPLLPANRAMAYIKLKKFKAAEKDCSRALQLDPKYIKAYLRRATARVAISNVAGAVEDYEQVMKLEPWNTDAKRELEKLKTGKGSSLISEDALKADASSKMKKLKVESVESHKNEEDSKGSLSKIRAVDKPVQLQSKKPLVKVPVIDVNSREQIESLLASQDTKDGNSNLIASEDGEKSTVKDLPSDIEERSTAKNLRSYIKESSTAKNLPSGIEERSTTKNLPSGIEERSTTKNLPSDPEERSTAKDLPPEIDVKSPTKDLPSVPEVLKSSAPLLPKPPKTSHQFSQDWRRICQHKDIAGTYLKNIPSSTYARIEIEVDQLVEISLMLCDEIFDPITASSIMAAVIKSRGFLLNLSFLQSDQKEVFQKIISKIEACEETKKEVKLLKDSL